MYMKWHLKIVSKRDGTIMYIIYYGNLDFLNDIFIFQIQHFYHLLEHQLEFLLNSLEREIPHPVTQCSH